MDILMDLSDSDKNILADSAPDSLDDHFATIIPRRWMFMRAYEDALEAQAAPDDRSCDDHCTKCGLCEWEPCTVPANIKTITMKRYDNQKLCPDCAPASWLERIDYWMRPIDRRFWMWTDKRFGRKGTPKP